MMLTQALQFCLVSHLLKIAEGLSASQACFFLLYRATREPGLGTMDCNHPGEARVME